MRIPTLAVCTLAAIAAQDLGQSAHALPPSESTPEVSPRVVPKSPTAASLIAVAVTAPIADVQVEFSPSSPAVAQTTTIDQLEEPPTESPSESPPPSELSPQPSKATDPQAPDRPPETAPPSSGQYLQEQSPTTPAPSPTPASPTSPATSPSSPNSSSSPAPASSGLLTEPITPTVQIGTVTLPHRGALPASFIFPIRIRVTVDPSITTNTPITNSTPDLATWEQQVRACLDEKPQIFAVQADGALAPILFDGQQGRILRNANGRMVCSALS